MKIKSEALRAALKFIDRWLSYQSENNRRPGFTVAIQINDKIVFNKAYGYANLESEERMRPEHVFRVASHSKTFTAVAIMQLFEAKKLRLDDTLATHIPWLKKHKDERMHQVTIRQVLEHASGVLRDTEDANFWRLDGDFPDREELKKRTLAAKPVFDSNQQFKYSNFGYSLLGQVIEQVSGQSYNDYVTKHIIEKLKLKNTYPEYSSQIENMAQGYTGFFKADYREKLPHVSTNAFAPATGFCATAEDLCKYVAALFYGSNKLINDSAKRELLRMHWDIENEDTYYGMGFDVRNINKHKVYGHGGGFPGFITNTTFDPKDKLAVAVLHNSLMSPSRGVADGVFKTFDYFADNYKPKKSLDKYEGNFYSVYGATMIVNVGDKLIGIWPESLDPFSHVEELKPAGNDSFTITSSSGFGSPGEKVKFNFNQDGSVAFMNNAGYKLYQWQEFRQQLKNLGKRARNK